MCEGAVTSLDTSIRQLTESPHQTLAAARELGPIVWVPVLDAWIVTDRSTAIAVMRDPERFTVNDPRFSTGHVLGPSMLSTDGDEHRRHRGPFVDWFASRSELAALTDWMNVEAVRLVETIKGDGHGELRTAIAAPLAANTLARLLGLDPPGAEQLLIWYREIVAAVQAITAGEPVSDAATHAYGELRDAILVATDAGRAASLTAAQQMLGDDDLAANAAVILFGGIETSEGATANAFWHLLTSPELHAAVVGDPDLVPAFVEESLRLEPAATNVDRYATTDVTIGDTTIPAGSYVIVSLAAANRDPRAFPEPDTIRLDRPNPRQHTTFALGPHACLGIHIARAQTIAAVDAVIRGLPDLALGRDAIGPRGLVFRKPIAVTATWSA